ncbi:MAG TPA: peptidoglycan binding domain-containing protein, partial [Armatimonadota bacterium]|nr:peptidoglycan binding domain-containing protein [Armatimonadota bacterium]
MADDPSVATTEQPRQPSPEITPDGLLRAKGELLAARRRAHRGNPHFPPQRGKNVWIGAALFVAVSAGVFVLRAGARDSGNQILPGVTVWDVPVGGLSPEATKKALAQRTAKVLDAPLFLVDGSRSWTRTARKLGCGFDLDTAVNEAESLGRQGGIFRRALDRWRVRHHEGALKLQRTVDRKRLGEQLRDIAAQAHIPARQAGIEFNGSNFLISSA